MSQVNASVKLKQIFDNCEVRFNQTLKLALDTGSISHLAESVKNIQENLQCKSYSKVPKTIKNDEKIVKNKTIKGK